MNRDWVNNWFRLGVTDDVRPGAVIRKSVHQMDLALFKVDGEIFARADACGECGRALLDGKVVGAEVECAGCGRRICITQTVGPSAPALFPIMVVDNEIYAWIENCSELSQS